MNSIKNILDLKKSNLMRIRDLMNTGNIEELKKANEYHEYLNYSLSKFDQQLVNESLLQSNNYNYTKKNNNIYSTFTELNNSFDYLLPKKVEENKVNPISQIRNDYLSKFEELLPSEDTSDYPNVYSGYY